MSYTIDLAKPILTVLQKLDRPTTAEELAFRLRSSASVVREELDNLVGENLVTKNGEEYSIVAGAKSSSLENLYSY
jgi:predicted transcriptional regulator